MASQLRDIQTCRQDGCDLEISKDATYCRHHAATHRQPAMSEEDVREAYEIYSKGESLKDTAARYGRRDTNLREAFLRAGYSIRSRLGGAEQRAQNNHRNPTRLRPHVGPQICERNGCDNLTSGKQYRRHGAIIAPRFCQGHRNKKPKPRATDVPDDAPFVAFLQEVERRRIKLGWSQGRLAEDAKLSQSTVQRALGGARRGERGQPIQTPTLLQLGMAVGYEPEAILQTCELPEPGPIGWKLLMRRAHGASSTMLAEELGVSALTIIHWCEGEAIAPEHVEDAASVLELTSEERAAERKRWKAMCAQRTPLQQATIEQNDPGRENARARAKERDIFGKLRAEHPHKAKRALKKAIATRIQKQRVEIERDELADLLSSGQSFRAIARRYGCDRATVRERAIDHNLWTGETRQERDRKRKVRKAAQKATTVRQRGAADRRALAEAELPGLLRDARIGRRVVAELYGIDEKVAGALLKRILLDRGQLRNTGV